MNKTAYIVVVTALILGIGVAVYQYRSPQKYDSVVSGEDETVDTRVENGSNASATSTTEIQDISTSTSRITIQDTSKGAQAMESAPLPDLRRPIVALISLDKNIEEQAKKDVERLTAEVKENNELITSWLLLGIARKALGDYKASEEIWTFVTLKWPSDYVAYNNLGDLYKEYLKDYPKAEKAFQAVIIKEPKYIPGYVNLSELYRFFYKEKSTEVVPVLEQGLKANPESIELMLRIARYYADTGTSLEKAKQYYQMTIDESKRKGETDFASRIQKEMDELKI